MSILIKARETIGVCTKELDQIKRQMMMLAAPFSLSIVGLGAASITQNTSMMAGVAGSLCLAFAAQCTLCDQDEKIWTERLRPLLDAAVIGKDVQTVQEILDLNTDHQCVGTPLVETEHLMHAALNADVPTFSALIDYATQDSRRWHDLITGNERRIMGTLTMPASAWNDLDMAQKDQFRSIITKLCDGSLTQYGPDSAQNLSANLSGWMLSQGIRDDVITDYAQKLKSDVAQRLRAQKQRSQSPDLS